MLSAGSIPLALHRIHSCVTSSCLECCTEAVQQVSKRICSRILVIHPGHSFEKPSWVHTKCKSHCQSGNGASTLAAVAHGHKVHAVRTAARRSSGTLPDSPRARRWRPGSSRRPRSRCGAAVGRDHEVHVEAALILDDGVRDGREPHCLFSVLDRERRCVCMWSLPWQAGPRARTT